jgi:hypothetical protein
MFIASPGTIHRVISGGRAGTRRGGGGAAATLPAARPPAF